MTNKNNLNGKAWFGLAVAATSLSAFNQQQASAVIIRTKVGR